MMDDNIIRHDENGKPLERYQTVFNQGYKTNEQFAAEDADPNYDPCVRHFDRKFGKAREILVFESETAIWNELLQDCTQRAGVDAATECKVLAEICRERNRYQTSDFNAMLRPKQTPGLPSPYERRVYQ